MSMDEILMETWVLKTNEVDQIILLRHRFSAIIDGK